MTTPRRVGAETSKTRDLLLDCAEQLMVAEGYPAVTYRALAAKAEVTAALVQYYFPTRDDIFIAAIRRRSAQNLERLRRGLEKNPDEPLRVLWRFSQDESTAALTTEFLAIGNHRPAIREEIAKATNDARRVQLEGLRAFANATGTAAIELPVEALLFLVTGTTRLIRLEEGVGVSTTHAEVLRAFESFLDATETLQGDGPHHNAPPAATRKRH